MIRQHYLKSGLAAGNTKREQLPITNEEQEVEFCKFGVDLFESEELTNKAYEALATGKEND